MMKVTQAQFDELARVSTVDLLEIVDKVPPAASEATPVQVDAAPVVEAPVEVAPPADQGPAAVV